MNTQADDLAYYCRMLAEMLIKIARAEVTEEATADLGRRFETATNEWQEHWWHND